MSARDRIDGLGYVEVELTAEIEYESAPAEPINGYPGYRNVTKLTINGKVCNSLQDVYEAIEEEWR